MGLALKIRYKVNYICARYFGLYVCCYTDCVNQGFVDYKDKMIITCPLCREYLGLPQLYKGNKNG